MPIFGETDDQGSLLLENLYEGRNIICQSDMSLLHSPRSQLNKAKQKLKCALLFWSTHRKKVYFRRIVEFIQMQRAKRKQELEAFTLHASHFQQESNVLSMLCSYR